jgi:hypothetical protein
MKMTKKYGKMKPEFSKILPIGFTLNPSQLFLKSTDVLQYQIIHWQVYCFICIKNASVALAWAKYIFQFAILLSSFVA